MAEQRKNLEMIYERDRTPIIIYNIIYYEVESDLYLAIRIQTRYEANEN